MISSPEYESTQSFQEAISWAFQKYQTQITQKNDSLIQANIDINLQKEQAQIARNAERAQREIAISQKNKAEKAQVAEAEQRKVAVAEKENAQKEEARANKNALGWKAQKETSDSLTCVSQDNEQRANEATNEALTSKNQAERSTKGAMAAAGLFLIAFVGAFIFYRRSERQKSEISAQNEQIKLNQREMSHRIGNNLQLLINFLTDRFSYGEASAWKIAKECIGYIQKLSLIQNLIYMKDDSGSLVKTSIGVYISQLANEVMQVAQYDSTNSTAIFDIEEVNLSLENTLAIGFIVNEAVMNACKHAFPHHSKQRLTLV